MYSDFLLLEIISPAINAPVISATPNTSSAINDNNKHITKDVIANLLTSPLYLSAHILKTFLKIIANIIVKIKNNIILIKTKYIFTDVSARLVIIVKIIIPNISSIKAAPSIVFPALEFKLPSSFSV